MNRAKIICNFMNANNIELISTSNGKIEFPSKNCDICRESPGTREKVKVYTYDEIANDESWFNLEICSNCLRVYRSIHHKQEKRK